MLSAMRERIYGDEEIAELVVQATQKGILPADVTAEPEWSIEELERMVTQVQ